MDALLLSRSEEVQEEDNAPDAAPVLPQCCPSTAPALPRVALLLVLKQDFQSGTGRCRGLTTGSSRASPKLQPGPMGIERKDTEPHRQLKRTGSQTATRASASII